MYKILEQLKGKDFGEMKAKEFQRFIARKLSHLGDVFDEVYVPNRGDGHTGRIDLVIKSHNGIIAIEIDRKSPRKKSLFKLQKFQADKKYLILRSPFSIQEI